MKAIIFHVALLLWLPVFCQSTKISDAISTTSAHSEKFFLTPTGYQYYTTSKKDGQLEVSLARFESFGSMYKVRPGEHPRQMASSNVYGVWKSRRTFDSIPDHLPWDTIPENTMTRKVEVYTGTKWIEKDNFPTSGYSTTTQFRILPQPLPAWRDTTPLFLKEDDIIDTVQVTALVWCPYPAFSFNRSGESLVKSGDVFEVVMQLKLIFSASLLVSDIPFFPPSPQGYTWVKEQRGGLRDYGYFLDGKRIKTRYLISILDIKSYK